METSKKATSCEICQAKFGFTRPKHKCKRCKRNVCSNCGKGKRIIIGFTDTKQHRTCDICELDVQFQAKLRQMNNVTWNRVSAIGEEWIAAIPNLSKLKEETPFSALLKEADQMDQNDANFRDLENDVGKGRTDKTCFNFSFHEFLHYVQGTLPVTECRSNMKSVLKAHAMRNPSMGYVQGLNLVAAFLLCFLDEEGAFWVLTHLIENVLPPFYYSKTHKDISLFGYHAENFAIKKLLKETLELNQSEDIFTMESFVDMVLPSLMIPLLSDTLNVSGTFMIWDEMIKNADFTVMERAVLAIFKKNRELVLDQDLLTGRKYRDFFCRDITTDFLQIKAKAIDVSSSKVRALREEFGQAFEKEWARRSYKPRKTIVEGKNFGRAEIEQLQKEYQELIKKKGGKTTIAKEEVKLLLEKVAPALHSFINSEFGPLKLFDVFDVTKSGNISHSDFLAFSSLLIKGPIEEKALFCFKHHDKSGKNYLTPEEFAEFLDTITRASLVLMYNEVDPFVLEKVSSFKKTMQSTVKDIPKIKYADVQEKLMSNPLVSEVSQELEGRRRKSTALFTASRMKFLLKSPKDEEEKVKEPRVPSLNLDEEPKTEEMKPPSNDQLHEGNKLGLVMRSGEEESAEVNLPNFLSSLEQGDQDQHYLLDPAQIIRIQVSNPLAPHEQSLTSQLSEGPVILLNSSEQPLEAEEQDLPAQGLNSLVKIAERASDRSLNHQNEDPTLSTEGIVISNDSVSSAMLAETADSHSINADSLRALGMNLSSKVENTPSDLPSTTEELCLRPGAISIETNKEEADIHQDTLTLMNIESGTSQICGAHDPTNSLIESQPPTIQSGNRSQEMISSIRDGPSDLQLIAEMETKESNLLEHSTSPLISTPNKLPDSLPGHSLSQSSMTLMNEEDDLPATYPKNFDKKISQIPKTLKNNDSGSNIPHSLQTDLQLHHSTYGNIAELLAKENYKEDLHTPEGIALTLLAMDTKASNRSLEQENALHSQVVNPPGVLRQNYCSSMEREKETEDMDLIQRTYTIYRLIEKKLSLAVKAHVEDFIATIQKGLELATVPAEHLLAAKSEKHQKELHEKYHDIEYQTSQFLSSEDPINITDISEDQMILSRVTQASTNQNDETMEYRLVHPDHRISLEKGEDEQSTMRISQRSQQTDQGDISGISSIPGSTRTSMFQKTSLIRSDAGQSFSNSEISAKSHEERIMFLEDEPKRENLLVDQFDVIEEEDDHVSRSEDAKSKSDKSDGAYSRTASEMMLKEFNNLARESFIRENSPIFTDMKTAPKSKVDEVRATNRNKSTSSGSCQGCTIF